MSKENNPSGLGGWRFTNYGRGTQSNRKNYINLKKDISLLCSNSVSPYKELVSFRTQINDQSRISIRVHKEADYVLVCNEEYKSVVVLMSEHSEAEKCILAEILSSPCKKVFFDAKQDIKVLRKFGLDVKGEQLFDVSIADCILNSNNLVKQRDIKELALEYLSYDNIKNSGWCQSNLSNKTEHLEKEAHWLQIIYEKMKASLMAQGLYDTAELEFRCINVIIAKEEAGMFFDEKRWKLLGDDLVRTRDIKRKSIEMSLNYAIKYEEEILSKLKALGISMKQLSLVELRKQDTKNYPIINDIIQYLEIRKKLEAYSKYTSLHTNLKKGRLHPEYKQIGTVTGRITCSNPNLQSIPRFKEFRECFIPAPGYKFIIGDYSQIELRIAAEVSEDAKMISAFQEKIDLHRLTASFVTNKPYEDVTDDERSMAKVINFGLIYGMNANSLRESAYKEYGIEMNQLEAQTFRDRFFTTYQGISEWYRIHENINIAESRTILGRRRVWMEAPKSTELFNSIIQGTSADITKTALCHIYEMSQGMDMKIVCSVHDEILLESPASQAEKAKDMLKSAMIQAGQAFLKKVPIEVSLKICDSWAEK